jgi:hypothetical protein
MGITGKIHGSRETPWLRQGGKRRAADSPAALKGETPHGPHTVPNRDRVRRAPRRRAANQTVTADDSVARALDIGPDSSVAERTIDITTLGARSGLPRRIEIWFHHVHGRWYLTGMPVPRSWYANLRANPRFVVHLKHGVAADLHATAMPVDERTRRRVITEVLALQDRPRTGGRVPRQNLDDWLAHSPLVEIVFDDEQLRSTASARTV